MTRLGKFLTFLFLCLLLASTQLYAVNPPSTQARYLTFSNIHANDATVSWVNGNGGHRIVVVREDPFDPDDNPLNGTQYTVPNLGFYGDPNPDLEEGRVVYNGSGTTRSFTLTNLQPGTTYYVKVFEFAVGAPTSPAYNVSNSVVGGTVTNPRSFMTTSIPPTVLAANPIGPVKAVLNWESLPGATSYILQVFEGENGGGPVLDIYDEIDVGNVTSFEVDGLDDDTDYSYRVRAVFAGGISDWSVYSNFTTLEDDTPPAFTVEYYKDAYYQDLMASPVFLKPGTYFVKITTTDPSGMMFAPEIGFQSEGLSNSLPTNQATDWLFDNLSIDGSTGRQEFAYTRTIGGENDADATQNDMPHTLISGTDASNNTADNVTPTNAGIYEVYIDNTAPTIISGTEPEDVCNAYVDVTFSEPIRANDDGTGIVEPEDFTTRFLANGGDATNVLIASLTRTDGDPLTGDELTIRFNLTIVGSPDGIETINIGPEGDDDVFDRAGNAMDEEQGTGILNLTIFPHFIVQPTDQSVCEGGTATFSATVDDATEYQWQIQDGTDWDNLVDGVVYAGVTTNTLTVNDITDLDGATYRLLAWTDDCPAGGLPSDPATLTIYEPLSITDQPVDATVCEDGNASFSVEIEGDGTISYQWQIDLAGTWTDLSNDLIYSGVTTNTLNITVAPDELDGAAYRVVITTSTGCNSPLISDEAVLTVNEELTIDEQPENTTVCEGITASFDVTASGGGIISYQWQINNGGVWTNLINDATYSGVTTDELTITNPDTDLSGTEYRVVVTGTNGCNSPINSDFATLTVNEQLEIETQPSDMTACIGSDASFTVEVVGGGTISYQWQVSTDGGLTFTNILDAIGSTLEVDDVTLAMDGYQYRVVVTGTNGCDGIQTSDAATLTVPEEPTVVTNPEDATVCAGSGHDFTATFDDANTYQWQILTGAVWMNIENGGVYSGATTTTLHISNVAGLNGQAYRLTAQNMGCPIEPVATDEAELIVPVNPFVTQQPTDATVCAGTSHTFTAAFNDATSYQWQIWTGATWVNLTDAGVYSGVTTNILNISDVTGLDDTQYRLTAQNDGCPIIPIATNAATLEVPETPSFLTQPVDATVCENSIATFTATVDNADTYQWELSIDGNTWFALENDAEFSGVTTNTLSIVADESLDGTMYRLLVQNEGCPVAFVISDVVTLTINLAPEVFAGPDAEIFEGQTFTINGSSAENYEELEWTTSGDGQFNDAEILHPTYTPGLNDVETGEVILTLTVSGFEPCGDFSDDMELDIIPEPEPQATDITFVGDEDATSIEINWVPGSGEYRIILMKQGAPGVWPELVDGTTYPDGNLDFAAASSIGDYKVIANGDVTGPITVTNILPNTVYWVKIYEYNGDDLVSNYNNSSALRNPWQPLYLEPTASLISPATQFQSQTNFRMNVQALNRSGNHYDNNETVNFVSNLGVFTPASVPFINSWTMTFTNAQINLPGGGNDIEITAAAVGFISDETTIDKLWAKEPAVQASYMIFTGASGVSPNIVQSYRFTRGSTFISPIVTPNAVLVLARYGTVLIDTPIDGITYAANSIFGLGEMIGSSNVVFNGTYAGSPTELNVSGLSCGQQLRLRAFEYNGAGEFTNYNMSGGTFNPRSASLPNCRTSSTDAYVELNGYNAFSSEKAVYNKWDVMEENAVLGYVLYRADMNSDDAEPNFVEVSNYKTNTDLLSTVYSNSDKKYSYVDTDPSLVVGNRYLYKLAYVGFDGQTTDLAEREVTILADRIDGVSSFMVSQPTPNPAVNEIKVSVTLTAPQYLYVEVIEMNGRRISVPVDGTKLFNAGENVISIPLDNVASGTYILNVSGGGEASVQKFVVVK